MHADKKKFLEWSMPGYSENCVSGGGEIIVYKSPTYSKCLLLAQCPKHKQIGSSFLFFEKMYICQKWKVYPLKKCITNGLTF